MLIGALFVAMCSYLAAVYLIGEARSRHDVRRRALLLRRARPPRHVRRGAPLAALARTSPRDATSTTGSPGERSRSWGWPVRAVSRARAPRHGRSRGLGSSALGVAAVLWGWGSPSTRRFFPEPG